MATIRPANDDDFAALTVFAAEQFCLNFAHLYDRTELEAFLAESYDPARWLNNHRNQSERNLIAEGTDGLVGYLKYGPNTLPIDALVPPQLEIKHLYLASETHGTGLAAQLMDRAIAEAKGCGEIVLGVYSENHRAIRFYTRYGFEPVGGYLFAVGRHRDREVICRKIL